MSSLGSNKTMANKDWKEAIRRNYSFFKGNIANPMDVAEYLYGEFDPPLLTEDMKENVKVEKTTSGKVGKMLDTLLRRGPRVPQCLYEAFKETENLECAEKLVPYIEQQKSLDFTWKPSEWPPPKHEHTKMWKEEVRYLKPGDPGALHYPLPDHPDDSIYSMNQERRGLVLLINNQEFSPGTDLSFRDGSSFDAKHLAKIFNSLHFEVIRKTDLTAEEVITETRSARDCILQRSSDCFVFIILSHGEKDGIDGVDGKPVPINQLTEMFSPINCPSLTGKPKIFLIQACRGDKRETVAPSSTSSTSAAHHDGFLTDQIPNLNTPNVADLVVEREASTAATKEVHSTADFLIAFSTPEGSLSWRHQGQGSWFMQAIIWIFKFKACSEHMVEMLGEVNNLVSQGKAKARGCESEFVTVSNFQSSLRKKLYFYPGLYGAKRVHPECNKS